MGREREGNGEREESEKREYNNVASRNETDEKQKQGRHRGNREDERDTTVEAR